MKRSTFAAVLLAGAAAISMHAIVAAQQAGTNVNVLPAYPIGNTFPPSPITARDDSLKGDNYLKQQSEPTVAASTYNADHLVAAFNDFRIFFANDTGLPGSAAQGWIGYSRSYDRGKTWYGAMVPGFPSGTSAADLSSPLHGLAAGSDPALVTTPGGHFYLGGLFFTPGGISNIAVMHLRDVPSLDGGDSIKPGKITIIDRGSQSDSGNFEDKPAFGADIARGTTDPSVCGPVYAAYTIFVGGGGAIPFVSKIGFSRSTQGKCGEAWDKDIYLNKNYKQNQGTAIAVDPNSGKIYVVWRHVFVPGGDGFPDSILIASSTDFGSSFSNPTPITGADFAPYDQISIDSNTDPSHMAFRSSAFPAIAVDGFGNVYVAVQERVALPSPIAGYNEPRIVIRSLRAGSNTLTKNLIDPGPVIGGQQVMPSLAFSAGVLRAMWYDFRKPESFPNDPAWGLPSTCDNAGHCYITGLDRRMETRLAQLAVNNLAGLAFAPSVPVTKYQTKVLLGGLPTVNRPNLPMYVGGTTAFTGDYITVAAGSPFVSNAPGANPPFRWATQSTDITALPSLTAWTDSRDVVFPIGLSGRPELSVASIQAWQSYSPPGTTACINPGSRNQNVYFSEVKTGVIAGSPATSRQLVDGSGHPFERAFPFYVQNLARGLTAKGVDGLVRKAFRLTFQSDSSAVKGSFVQGTANTTPQLPAPFIDVSIGPISTVSKTIYAYCPLCTAASAFGRFSIKVDEIDHIGGSVVSGGLTTQLRFNSDPTAPFVTNPQLANQEIHTVSFSTADWSSADWSSADWSSADWSSADWSSADWSSADWSSADWSSADWSSADWSSADWSSADWSSADWSSTSPVGDLVSKATDVGNNASSYSVSVNIDPALAASLKAKGYIAGLFITRSYNKPDSFANCAIQPIPLEQVISIIPLDLNNLQTTVLDTAAFAAAPLTNSTLAAGNSSAAAEIQPDNVYIVLRLFGPRNGTQPPPPVLKTDPIVTQLKTNTTTTVTPQAGDTTAGKTTATVTLSNLSPVFTGSPLTPTATTNPPGLTVVFSGAPQTNVGTYPVLATINNATYQGSATGTFRITPAPTTTTVTCPGPLDPPIIYNGSAQTPCSANVTGAGGLNQPLTVSYLNNTNAGTATASASYAGDGNHSGSSDSKPFTISQAPSTTTFGAAPTPTFGGGNFTVSASNNSGGTITYSYVSGPCALVNAGTGTFSSTGAGSCVVRADSAVTTNYLASFAQQTVTINPASSATAFDTAPTPTYPGPNFTVHASNNSGGAITYSAVSGPCMLVDANLGTFSPTGVGSCVVQADSATTANYFASSAQQTVAIAALPWVATTNANCSAGSPEIAVSGNTIVMGTINSPDTSQPVCIHGATVLLPALTGGNTKYQLTFSYNLFTWDSYNAVGTPGFSGTGYFDSFSVSVSGQPYASLVLQDPITTANLPGLGFIWGGNDYNDGTLECNPNLQPCASSNPAATLTVTVPGNPDGNYLNVVLDTKTNPESDTAHPSYGTITILNVVQVP